MGANLDARRQDTARRLSEIREGLVNAEQEFGDRACVYTTGSFGRGEASSHSDLDLFIVGPADEKGRRSFPNLDEICLKADLIRLTRRQRFPEFSGDGEYLNHYTVHDLVKTLGQPEDDSSNTLTARLLLLLESQPVLGVAVYKVATEEVIRAYWRDYEGHEGSFMPAYLANDILRLWRTLCVNYEARTSTEPATKKAKRKLKNYKLKHSRLLTCYTALLYLLSVHKTTGTVTKADAMAMIELTPTKRVEWLRTNGEPGWGPSVNQVLDCYDKFLGVTDRPEAELVEHFLDKELSAGYVKDASQLGDAVFELLAAIGGNSSFYRLLVV